MARNLVGGAYGPGIGAISALAARHWLKSRREKEQPIGTRNEPDQPRRVRRATPVRLHTKYHIASDPDIRHPLYDFVAPSFDNQDAGDD